MLDAIDKYMARLREPAIRAYWREIHGDIGDLDTPEVGETDLIAKEAELGYPLPPSYRKLVTTTRPEDGIYGVRWPDELANFENRSDPYPPFLIGIVDHGDGDFDCFDTRHPDGRGEYPIVRYDHEIHTEDSTDFEIVAPDFGEYLLGSLGGETPI